MYDTEQFIQEIHLQPAIWDSNKEVYNNKTEKTKAWETVCTKLFPNFAKKSHPERNDIASQLKRRWKSLRDSYTREVGRMKRFKSYGRKQYVFFNQLNFLQSVVMVHNSKSDNLSASEENGLDDCDSGVHEVTNQSAAAAAAVAIHQNNVLGDIWNTTGEDTDDLQQAPSTHHQQENSNLDLTAAVTSCSDDLWQNTSPADLWTVAPPDIQQQVAVTTECGTGAAAGSAISYQQQQTQHNNYKRKREASYSERNLYNLLNQSIQLRLRRNVHAENDSDRLFMLSLVPDLKALPEHVKLEAKCEIMSIFKKFKRYYGGQHEPSTANNSNNANREQSSDVQQSTNQQQQQQQQPINQQREQNRRQQTNDEHHRRQQICSSPSPDNGNMNFISSPQLSVSSSSSSNDASESSLI